MKVLFKIQCLIPFRESKSSNILIRSSAIIFLASLAISCSFQEKTSENGSNKASIAEIAPENIYTNKADFNIGKPEDSLKIIFLLNFYSRYIPVLANSLNEDEISLIQEEASSKELLEKIDSADIDYDPYLNAQDANESSVQSLGVKQCGNDKDIFCVSFLTGYKNQQAEIKLQVQIIEGKPKITDIIGLN